ncbi:DUF4231 domain-containing protein [Polymorphospora rubra]|uniref:DUF4231 domain-containing protein n=1 Tax=Polymorphospora rubra TaxID=338584 RepID=A0A810MXK4_9ACTN|nr:DUF4231 domain-containing protein [Polymorphospora rubra]BCJ65887.1 hypothetical protein Prubr_29080 [Polymorphospora rubra]
MWSYTRRLWRGDNQSKNKQELIDMINDDGPDNWHIDHVRSRIIDAEEKLHLQQIWKKAGIAWITAGNSMLIALAVLAISSKIDEITRISTAVYIACGASLLISPALTYWQYRRTRKTRVFIKKLHLVRRRVQEQEDSRSNDVLDAALQAQKRYRDDTPDLISQFREDAGKTRALHNRLQSVIIVGSVATSAIATASVSYAHVRWVTVGASTVVGLAAGFMGYFKYHERSFNSQQTADAIEREYEAVELRVGNYKGLDESRAYSMFAESVERLRDEQNKRQQQLDQPVEAKRE